MMVDLFLNFEYQYVARVENVRYAVLL